MRSFTRIPENSSSCPTVSRDFGLRVLVLLSTRALARRSRSLRVAAEEEDADAADVGRYPLGFEGKEDEDGNADDDNDDDKVVLILTSETPPYCTFTRVWAMFSSRSI